jgi:hypothetical protein
VVCEFDGCENRRGACLTPRHPSRMCIMSDSKMLRMPSREDASLSNRCDS